MEFIHSAILGASGQVRGARRGFALLITIVLVAFLVLILVGLAAFTRVETQVAANARAMAQARQNALMGLSVALGQLQRYAGPDNRITAQGALADSSVNNPWFTGVWDADAASGTQPMTWLVSGNETAPLVITTASNLDRESANPEVPLIFNASGVATNGPGTAASNRVRLVGDKSSNVTGTGIAHGGVVVPGVPLDAEVPGYSGVQTTGRYAFWVGDQGVKAAVGLADRSDEVRYAPWFDPNPSTGHDLRKRIRQQIGSVPTNVKNNATESYGFDPLASDNFSRLNRLFSPNQVQFLTPVAPGVDPLGDFRRGYHDLAATTYAVLANTLPSSSPRRGLLRDLSTNPEMLGAAYQAYASYSDYMELAEVGNSALPPITSYSSMRRRYEITPRVSTPAGSGVPRMDFGVSPILNAFYIQFRATRSSAGANGVRLYTRAYVELWNPYTAALVPTQDLSIEVRGLPSRVLVSDSVAGVPVEVDYSNFSGMPVAVSGETDAFRVMLPFVASGGRADRASWFPGRMYAWSTGSGTGPTNEMAFYIKSAPTGWEYPAVVVPGSSNELNVVCPDGVTLGITLKKGTDVLAVYTSDPFDDFSTGNGHTAVGGWCFAYAMRLKQPSTFDKDRDWLTTPGSDLRNQELVGGSFTPFNVSLDFDPDAYRGSIATAASTSAPFLIYRAMGTALSSSASANHDAPVFELPRLPALSLGELQHLHMPDLRSFAVGNPWGGETLAWFDQYFLSGLASGVVPDLGAGQPLPAWHLKPVAPLDGNLDVDDIRDGGNPLTSRFLLAEGAFNLNSVSQAAWRAVLSRVRFSQDLPFERAFIENDSSAANTYNGTQPVSGAQVSAERLLDSTLGVDLGGGAFFRFPQSAQETYFWSNSSIDGNMSKQAFRQGVRGGTQAVGGSSIHQLSSDKIEDLAAGIVDGIRLYTSANGPFRSVEAFLSSQPSLGGVSVIERAIDQANINPPGMKSGVVPDFTDVGFSSLTLTQADVMTALAPFLRSRSDTFLVRFYGETVNPASKSVEGKAWGEAMVQRFPQTVDSGDNVETPLITGFGRKFKILDFRWLNSSDI